MSYTRKPEPLTDPYTKQRKELKARVKAELKAAIDDLVNDCLDIEALADFMVEAGEDAADLRRLDFNFKHLKA